MEQTKQAFTPGDRSFTLPSAFSLLGLLEKEARRRRIILTQSQKDTLRVWFEKNPNPDLATRGHLAKELGISESQIMVGIRPLSLSESG
jgi:hypothetical protein